MTPGRAGRLAATLLLSSAAAAQGRAPRDSVRAPMERALGSVVVADAPRSAGAAGVARVPVAGVVAREPASLADAAALLPGAAAATNSRGETLVVLRGAGERQTAVRLDGAPLTVPWDRRLDLGLVPAGVVGGLGVTRGPASLAAGPHAAGGAVDLLPRTRALDGALTEAELSGGVPARGRVAATHLRRHGPWRATLALDASARAGAAVPQAFAVRPELFSQSPDGARTNTDRAALGVIARVAHAPSARRSASATVLHLDAAQGVAPEGHLDPRVDRVRYWRLPAWRHTLAAARVRAPLRPAALDAAAWAGRFEQTILRFPDARYAAADGGQRDRDVWAGASLVAETEGGAGLLRGIAWGQAARHDQRALTADASRERFDDVSWRLAAEAEPRAGPVRVLAGVSLDGTAPLATAGRASAGAFRLLGGVLRAEAPLGNARVHAGVARTGRVPTMRERFGEALGRFALTPDLRPETTWQAELGAARDGAVVSVWATAFARRTGGTIEQEALADGRRRRINLGRSRAAGVEAALALRAGGVRVDAGGTLMHLRGERDGAAVRLPERPELLGRVAVTRLPGRGWTWAVEAVGTGRAVSLGPAGDEIALPAAVVVGLRLGRRWALGGGLLDAFVRLDNATDALVLPQAGLPAPGREARVGVRWSG